MDTFSNPLASLDARQEGNAESCDVDQNLLQSQTRLFVSGSVADHDVRWRRS
jgi:hypothetical protein